MRPKQWIDKFLQKRGLSYEQICKNPKPLYQYRLQNEEFESLKQSIKTPVLFGLENIFKREPRWDAAFVLYATEWWRREYEGSSWRWKNIFASIGADVQELNALQRNLIIENGLRYWQRETRKINGNTRYLGSIAIEGGLPLNQLTNSDSNGGWLGRVFKQAIPKYTRFQSSGVTAIDIVSEYKTYFPQTYQNEQIYSILADMLDAIITLKKVHQLDQQTNPVDFLDQNAKNWREQFPLPINNDVSVKLLSEMITTAAKADETEGRGFYVLRFLNNDYRLGMQIEFEPFITLEKIFSDTAVEDIPSRLDVEIISDNNSVIRLGCAFKTIYKGKSTLKMPCRKYDVDSRRVTQTHRIRFKNVAETIKEIDLTGGEALDDELPWVFRSQNENWILEGVASVSTRAKQVRILYPENLNCDTENKQVLGNIDNKILIEASGTILLADEDNAFIIKTAQPQSGEHYSLQGKTLNFSSNLKELYLGLPSLKCINNETGIKKDIPAKQLISRAVNSKNNWQSLSSVTQGIYEIRFQGADGNIKFRKRCVLLPDDFAIRLKPLANSLDGIIYLDNTGNAEVVCDSQIRHTINNDKGSYQIELNADNAPPASVNLSLRWLGMAQVLTLKIPFPARGGKIIDSEGEWLKQGQSLFQESLHGFRVHLFNESPSNNKHLQLDFCLVDEKLKDVRDLYFRYELKRKGSVIELAVIDYLEWIKDLLAISRSLDGYVKFSVYESGAELVSVKIYQYQMSLQINNSQGCVYLNSVDNARLSYPQIAAVKLKAMRLSQPEQQHINLEAIFSEQTEVGSWFFYPEKRVPEQWLIYPCADSSISLRPMLWIGTNDFEKSKLQPLKIISLHTAVMIEPPFLRQLVVKKILAQMCFDFGHSGWEYLRKLTQETEHLPLTCFDVWSLVVANSKMLAALVLQMNQKFIEKLTIELPVFWELITLAEWFAIFKHYEAYLQKMMGDDKDVKELLELRLKQIDYLPVSMEMIGRLLKLSLCDIPDQELSFMKTPVALSMVISQLDEAQHELDRRQANSEWLIILKSELKSCWNDLDESSQQLLNVNNVSEHHFSTFLLPVLLASFCLKGIPKNWLADAAHIFKLKQLKAFDEEWFNTAFRFSLAYLSQLPKYNNQFIKDADNMINVNDDEIKQLDEEIEQQIKELEKQTAELKINTEALETEVEQSSSISEDLELFKMENEDLKKELVELKENHQQFVDNLRQKMQQRDKALKYLLAEVKKLNQQMQTVKQVLIKKNQVEIGK